MVVLIPQFLRFCTALGSAAPCEALSAEVHLVSTSTVPTPAAWVPTTNVDRAFRIRYFFLKVPCEGWTGYFGLFSDFASLTSDTVINLLL